MLKDELIRCLESFFKSRAVSQVALAVNDCCHCPALSEWRYSCAASARGLESVCAEKFFPAILHRSLFRAFLCESLCAALAGLLHSLSSLSCSSIAQRVTAF